MPDQSPTSGAPAPTGPEPEPQVDIALGPDQSIYPENLRPQPEPATPPVGPPEPEPEASADESTPDVAGPDEPQGSRRQRGDEAYQRGLAEGRAALEREQAQRQQQDQFQQTQREANQRVEQLFNDLSSADY